MRTGNKKTKKEKKGKINKNLCFFLRTIIIKVMNAISYKKNN